MKTYKVWISIEEYDSETDAYSDDAAGLPDPIRGDLSLPRAREIVRDILAEYNPAALATSDNGWKSEGA